MFEHADQPFDSPTRLWTRASSLMDELRATEEKYFHSDSVGCVGYRDPETGQKIVAYRVHKLPNREIETVLKDAITNLRDALDHSVFAGSTLLSGKEVDRTAFPFAKNPAGVRARLQSKHLRDVHKRLWPIIEKQRPYEGGNDVLVGLNKLRNPSTHRQIMPTAVRVGSHAIHIHELHVGPGTELLGSGWDDEKMELVLARLSQDSTGSIDLEVRAYFAFAKETPFARKAVGPVLYQMRDEVARVIREIRDEAERSAD